MTTYATARSYENIFFYKIYSKELKKCSIHYSTSSTGCWIVARRSLSQRKNLSDELLQILMADDMRTDLIEYYPCKTLNQVLLRYDKHIIKHNSINKRLSDFDKKMYEKFRDLHRHAYYHKVRCTEEFKQKQKEYRKLYYQNNPDKYRALGDYGEYITCECGRKVREFYLSRHRKSNIHIKWLEKKYINK